MLRTPLISKVRLAAEQLEQQRERPVSEPKPQVRERPSSRPWKWATPIVGPLALYRIVVETITKQLDRQRERPGSEPKPQVRERLSSRRLVISKVRLAAEQLEQQRERPGSEPKPQVRERPSSRPWKWATPIVGPLALCRIVVETITKQLD